VTRVGGEEEVDTLAKHAAACRGSIMWLKMVKSEVIAQTRRRQLAMAKANDGRRCEGGDAQA
jgi:hypothetical protein